MTRRALVVALALVLLTPAIGAAVTIEDVVALSRAGLADSVLIAVIDADRTVFDLTPNQIVSLRDAGVPNAVIVKMLATKREFAPREEAPPPVVIIGESPSSLEPHDGSPYFGAPFYGAGFPVAAYPIVPVVPGPGFPVRHVRQPQTPYRGFGRFINDGWVDGVGFGRFINDGWIQPTPIVPTTTIGAPRHRGR